MIKWHEHLKRWIFEFTVELKKGRNTTQRISSPLSINCADYKEAWFFRTYEEDMDLAFVRDYLENK